MRQSKTPGLHLIPGTDVIAAPLTGSARVQSLIKQANDAAKEMVVEYSASLRVLADKAREIAELDKNAPVGIVTAAGMLAAKLDMEADGIDAILLRG